MTSRTRQAAAPGRYVQARVLVFLVWNLTVWKAPGSARTGYRHLLDPSSQLLVLPAARPGVKLERPQPRSGEDERA